MYVVYLLSPYNNVYHLHFLLHMYESCCCCCCAIFGLVSFFDPHSSVAAIAVLLGWITCPSGLSFA